MCVSLVRGGYCSRQAERRIKKPSDKGEVGELRVFELRKFQRPVGELTGRNRRDRKVLMSQTERRER